MTLQGEDIEVWRATRTFIDWLDRHGIESHDPYDIWGTRYGVAARRIYYQKPRLGALLVAPVVAGELFCPRLARLFVKKQRFATAEAQLALGFLNLYELTRDSGHLTRAKRLVSGLLDLSIPGYNGHCWGYPFDWQNSRGLWKKNTPFITSTPYCFEAYLGAADATGNDELVGVAASIARFVACDLNDTPVSTGSAAGSYSPIDRTHVINASAYRAFVLFEAWRRFQLDEYRDIAERNLRFVINSQREDGSWLYALNSPAEAFIDHFHTCFVLKNLFKLNQVLHDAEVDATIDRGWRFYRRALFDADDTPKSFSIEPRLQIGRAEIYNFAEAISLAVQLSGSHPDSYPLARRLARRVIETYQLPSGYFVTRVYAGGLRHTQPFLRWPQAQMFLAFTRLLAAASDMARGVTTTSALSTA